MGESKNKLEAVRTKWNLREPTGTLVSLITSTLDAVCDMQGNRHPSPTGPTTGFGESEGVEGKGKERGSLELSWLLPHTNQASRRQQHLAPLWHLATAAPPPSETWVRFLGVTPHLPNHTGEEFWEHSPGLVNKLPQKQTPETVFSPWLCALQSFVFSIF